MSETRSLSSPSLWKQILRSNFSRWEDLARFLELSPEQQQEIAHCRHFPLNLPLRLAQKMEKGTLDDPLVRQFLPTQKEGIPSPHFSLDPVEDASFRRSPKLLKKYQGRALLLVTSACAMHCRYCFRQHFSYEKNANHFLQELEYIRSDLTLQEVILSGGDPLSLSNEKLLELITALEQISHIQRLRFHTRFPIGIPERIDCAFVEMLKKSRLKTWFVLHVNHVRELDKDILDSLQQLQSNGIPVLTQSVLLKGVNDDGETLYELYETLVNHGIFPYYLHQLDPVQGAMHFAVSDERGRALLAGLQERLPGYAIPRFVREIPGRHSKTALVS